MNQSYTTTFTVDQTPEEAFDAINNVRGWWSGDIEGDTDKLGEEFTYHYEDIHYSKQKITELSRGNRVAWHVVEANLNFTQVKDEWTGTDITFDIAKKGDRTEIRFTHQGLVPAFECFDNCSTAWGSLIMRNLWNLIVTGKDQPDVFTNEADHTNDETPVGGQDFTIAYTVDQTPEEVFAAITNMRAWWSEDIVGGTKKVDDEFDYHFADVHHCKMKLTELVPNQKIVWHVLENHFNFTKDTAEWTDTDIIFEIYRQDDKTQIRFTHRGLVPAYECFDICSNAWGSYINGSLRNLITTGRGKPNSRERPTTENEKRLLEARAK